uniref:Uncharacterized protein n=1 Tax=Arundo donax TaxID=35708 RepID=A0A0A8Z1R8_ARUDO
MEENKFGYSDSFRKQIRWIDNTHLSLESVSDVV